MTRVASCHPDQKSHAKGKCRTCYNREYQRAYYHRSAKIKRKAIGRAKKYQAKRPEVHLAAQGRYRNKNRERLRAADGRYRLTEHGIRVRREKEWRSYGIKFTHAQYDAMLEAQDGRCAICKEIMVKPHVDHDRNGDGTPRGLLCFRCNIGIGYLRHTPQILLGAAEYLSTAGDF